MHVVLVCKGMLVCECGGRQVVSRVPFLGSTLCKKKSSWTPVERPKLFRMSYWPWWATRFAQGPPYSAPTCIPSPLLQQRIEIQGEQGTLLRRTADSSITNPPPPHQALNKVAAAERTVEGPPD